METPPSFIETLADRAEQYGHTSLELAKLQTLETTTHVVTSLISRLSVITLLSVFAVFLSIGIAMLLGEVLGKSWYGFFIVAAFYLVAGIVVHFFLHKWIKRPISELIITRALQ